ncbi:hypothetical protein KC19_8G112000 [Ceratodon purpureus]|uniref:Uncharacterized protein n=1 Tax=Ceratodon purpureus TaxID=3225 RepID=A0A8T0GZG8_CERPU|nr:hypothetical protein KC19_8G112000 [Ceratodon purpureus]
MENVEAEGGVVVRRRRKLNKTERNVIIAVATVAGLGLVGKLVSVLRREKPKKKKDEDVETLESVLSGDESDKSNLPLQARVQRTKLANLDNDEPDHEVVNRKRNSRRSKYADSFSEIISEDDITNDGELFVNQDPVGRRERTDRDRSRENSRDARNGMNNFTSRKSKQLSLSEGGFNIKGVSHFNGENGGKHHDEDGGRRRGEDGGRNHSRDGGRRHSEDGGRHHSKDGGRRRREDGGKHDNQDRGQHHDEDGSESPSKRSRKESSEKESSKKDSTNKSESLEKRPRRTSSGEPKQGRKSKSSGEEKVEKRKLKTLSELSDDKEVKEVIFDEAGRWESVNGYKVLKATTSKIPTFTETMHKLEADGSLTSLNDNVHLVREFERERAETEKAQSIWDGKIHTKKKNTTEGSEAYLQIKSSVVSSVAGTEETPEGMKVREVVKRSTLLPIPSGDESEVHSSVYNVRETDKGLKVEEVVTRTKLVPAKGDFTMSDQQLLRKTFSKKSAGQFKNLLRNDALVMLLRIIAVLVTIFSVLLILNSRKRIPLPSST